MVWDASLMGLSLWSGNSEKLALLCGHGHHRPGCGDVSMMGLSLLSENLAKVALFCGHKHHRAGCGDASMRGLLSGMRTLRS